MTDRKLYDAGWDDCIAYFRDKNELQRSQVGWGYVFILFGSILTALTVTAPVMMWFGNQHVYNWAPLVYMALIGIAMLLAGLFIDKKDTVRYKERETAHYKKWADRWTELGFKGDE